MLRTIFLREDLKPLEERFLLFLGCRLDGCPGEGKSVVHLPQEATRLSESRTPMKDLRLVYFPLSNVTIKEIYNVYCQLSKIMISPRDLTAYRILIDEWQKESPMEDTYR